MGNNGIDKKITPLGAGADGYLTRPFDRYKLMPNLDAIMRRTYGHGSVTILLGNLILDLSCNYPKLIDPLKRDLPYHAASIGK